MSVAVAQRAARNRTKNITIPLTRLPKKLQVAPPMISARKNNRRSAPQMVRGLLMARKTGCTWAWFGISSGLSRKQPCHEIHCPYRHANAKDDAGQRALGLSLPECKDQAT